MLARDVLILFLLACLVGVMPLAYASPPDPAWIPGIWDDDDQDDAIILATSGSHGVTTSWVEVGRPSLIGVATVPLPDPLTATGVDLGPVQSRAPPAV
jgi:hypothetical protein